MSGFIGKVLRVHLTEPAVATVTAEEIIGHCKERLAAYAVPKWVEFGNSLPMTVTQKISKKLLRDEEHARQQG